MTCAICNRFQGTVKTLSREETVRLDLGQRHHKVPKLTWGELCDSATTCYCCSILVSGCRGCFRQHGINETDILYASLRFYYPSCIDDAEEGDAMKFLVFFLRNGTRFEVELFVAEGDDHLIPGSWDYMLASERTLQRTGSEASLVTIKGWIAGCIVDHHTPESFCDSPERPHLPTRVVDVGLDDGIVKLVETNGARSKYICLSHCWGVSQVLTTTKSTLEQHKKGKIWDRLPKTFQDAISLIQPPI